MPTGHATYHTNANDTANPGAAWHRVITGSARALARAFRARVTGPARFGYSIMLESTTGRCNNVSGVLPGGLSAGASPDGASEPDPGLPE